MAPFLEKDAVVVSFSRQKDKSVIQSIYGLRPKNYSSNKTLDYIQQEEFFSLMTAAHSSIQKSVASSQRESSLSLHVT